MQHITKLAFVALVACGCARTPVSTGPRVALAPATPIALGSAQQRAQRAWCDYLDLLHRRAVAPGTTWPHHEACLREASNASPEMLERTASCARAALDGFEGDPLNAEYAAEVRRCGSEALDASALSESDIQPFLEAVCARAATCDGTPIDACRAAISARVSARLGRAIGAVNEASRARLRACFEQAACDSDMGDRLSGCVEPIMEKLLWLPPSRDR